MEKINHFTLEEYKKYLHIINNNWKIINFENVYKKNLDKRPKALIRHDIDLSLIQAKEIAGIENEMDVKSTYFIHLQNEFYNIFEPKSQKIIQEILKLGHQIGVHFDINSYSEKISDSNSLQYWACFEKKIYEEIFSCEINVVSLHNPTIIDSRFDIKSSNLAGMINTYSSYIFDEFEYISDSNGYWRHYSLNDFLDNNKNNNIQFLSHPGWWIDCNLAPYEKVKHHLKLRCESTIRDYNILLNSDNRLNIGR